MNNDLTDITFLLDRTGSMEGIASDVVGGYNAFLKQQQQAPGEAHLTLVQFDSIDPQEVIHDARPIGEVPLMAPDDFRPRSTTPLYDALGIAIVRTGERLAAIDEAARPGKVVFVVFTDGYENASQEYTAEQVRDMVARQTATYSWQFLFLGANIDAFAQGGRMSIPTGTTLDVSGAGVADAFLTTSARLADYRTSGLAESLHYDEDDRRRAKR